jgi:hypothetical protein
MSTPAPRKATVTSNGDSQRISYDGSGYDVLLLAFGIVLLSLAGGFAYAVVTDPEPPRLDQCVFFGCLLVPLVLLLVWAARMFTAAVEFTPTGVTSMTIFGKISIRWAEVGSVSFEPRTYALLLHSQAGRTIRLPNLTGCETSLEQGVRHHLPNIEF